MEDKGSSQGLAVCVVGDFPGPAQPVAFSSVDPFSAESSQSSGSTLVSNLAEASVELTRSSSQLEFVSRVRDLSLESLFEFAKPFMKEETETSPETPHSVLCSINAADADWAEDDPDDAKIMQNLKMTPAELEKAVDELKEKILALPENAEELRAKLVRKLVYYRLKLQDIEDIGSPVISNLQSLGHDFQRLRMFRKLGKVGKYCEVCGQLVIFSAYQMVCLSCGYLCHESCVEDVRRNCVADMVKSNPEFILDICPEKGLDSQDFRCAECHKEFPMHQMNAWDNYIKVCDYNGKYYCNICHRNNLSVNPGRIVKNWDFSPRPVSRESLQILSLLVYQPLLNLWELNKELFVHIEELDSVQNLRSKLSALYRILMDCKEPSQVAPVMTLLRRFPVSRRHLMERNYSYSLNDLVEIESGVLFKELVQFADEMEKHVKKAGVKIVVNISR